MRPVFLARAPRRRTWLTSPLLSRSFVTSYFPIWFFPVLFVFYRYLWRRDERAPSVHEMDFVSGSRDEQAFSEADPEPTAEPKSIGRKVLAYVL